MSARDVEQWLLDAAGSLASRGVKGVLGRSPDLGAGRGPSSWISLTSAIGSGRVVRHHDGRCSTDAHRYADGLVLVSRSSPITTSADLAEVVSAITVGLPT